jgi:hypothetical protein
LSFRPCQLVGTANSFIATRMADELSALLRDAMETGVSAKYEQAGLAIEGALQDPDISVKLRAVRSLHAATAECTDRSVLD